MLKSHFYDYTELILMKKRLEGFWYKLIFSLVFAGLGVGLFVLEVLPSLRDWHQMKTWSEVSAHLQDVKLISYRSSNTDDSETYEASARYTYHYNGQKYTGWRVAIITGGDNLGDFQWRMAARLKSALRNQQPVPAWVNPEQPNEAVLNRDMRWGMLAFTLGFVVAFGGLGTFFVVLCFISPASDSPAGELN